MAVRQFDGVNDRIDFGGGTLGGVGSGAFSALWLVKPGNINFFNSWDIGTAAHALGLQAGQLNDTTTAQLNNDFGTISWSGLTLDTTNWQLIGMSKAAGAVTGRFHRAVLGSGYTHTVSAGTNSGPAGSAAAIVVGCSAAGTLFQQMKLAAMAFWNTNLTDANFDSIASSTAQIQALSPSILWEFTQASVATAVTDLTGGGADQSSIVETTVVTTDDPAWTFSTTTPQAISAGRDFAEHTIGPF
jgi:hypothetical protein